MKKWLKKGSAVLLAVTMVLTLFPGMRTTVQAADKVEKKYWTDVAGLKEFNLSSSTTIGKIRFGLYGINGMLWAICGTDGNDGNDLAMLSTSAFKAAAYGTTSEYSKSNFVTGMNTYLSTTYFSDKELEKMAAVTVSTNEPDGSGGNHAVIVANKKLYLPNSLNEQTSGPSVTTIYVGSDNNIEIDVKKLTKANGFQDNYFWLRSPDGYSKSNALVAIPDYYVYYYDVGIGTNSVVPAFNLNLSSVLFASAADAALYEGILAGKENTYTLRYASTTDENGIISRDGGSVRVKDAEGKFLVAQNNSGAYAKQITKDDETIAATQMGMGTEITNFNDCKVWIESTDTTNRITTAREITDTFKDVPVLTVNPIKKTYDGNPVADSEITGTAKVDGADISGTWKFEAGQQLTNVQDSEEKKVIFTPTDTDMYASAQETLQLTINKAEPTGSPKFTKITEAGKTLADAALVKIDTTPENGFNVPGTVKWDDDDGTVIEANKSYGWTFTPNDTDNYETVKGRVIVYATGGGGSSSGGGGGGGSSSGTVATPETKIDPADAQSNLFGMASTIDVTGKERSETSMQLADQTKKALGVEKFSTIILASGTDFPDGLGVSALSIQQKAPVLIVTPGTEAAIKKYIEENLVSDGKVIISGGAGAVSQSMQNSLNGIDVTRLGGADRYKTNILTIKELLAKGAGKDEVLIASGKDFADALSASATGKIIMIVGDQMTEEQKALLKETGFGKITILGGTGAVSGSIENELNAATGKKAERVGGANRIETSKLIAARYFPSSTTSVYTKANGFADGLAGGLLANITGSPMRLSYGAGDMTAGGKAVTLGGVK